MELNIIGKGRGWEDAPRDGEAWGITQLILRRPVTRVIDMNDYTLWGDKELKDAIEARSRAAQLGVEYIDRDNYPYDQITKMFGVDYFSNTVDFAIALAIYENYTKINFYGVNMAYHEEYAYQKPGVDFWCGVAIGRGIKLKVYGESSILRTIDKKIYGYGTPQYGILIT